MNRRSVEQFHASKWIAMNSSHKTSDLTDFIDGLLDELTQLASDPQTGARDFFSKVTTVVESLFSPKYVAIFSSGLNQEIILIHGSQSISELGHLPETETNGSFHQFLFQATQSVVNVTADGDSQLMYVRLLHGKKLWGGISICFSLDLNLEPMKPVFLAVHELVQEFIKNQTDESSSKFLEELQRFSLDVHSSLIPSKVASHIANDGRLLLGVERLTVFDATSRKPKLLAVSSVSSVDPRSLLMKSMVQLVRKCVRTKQVCYSDQPPEEQRLQLSWEQFRRNSQAEFFIGIPVFETGRLPKSGRRVIGFLMFESSSSIDRFKLSSRLKQILPHVESALHNSLRLSGIPFGNFLSQTGGGLKRFPGSKPLLLAASFALILYFVASSKTDFLVRINGELRPVKVNNIFAPADGFVEKVLTHHGDEVRKDQLLIEMSSPSLDLEYEQLGGEVVKYEKIREAKRIALNQAASQSQLDSVEVGKLTSEIAELGYELASLEDKRNYIRQRLAELSLRSPIAGVVTTWQLKNSIDQKPVKWGEDLASVADEKGEWQLSFKVPEYRIGYILEAREAQDEPLEIQFFFESDPEFRMNTTIVEIGSVTRLDSELGPVVMVKCDVPEAIASEDGFTKRHGSRVLANVSCGKKTRLVAWTKEWFDSVRRFLVW